MPTSATAGYRPGSGTTSLASLIAVGTGGSLAAAQEYTVAMGWLAVLRQAAAHMSATPRLSREGALLASEIDAATGSLSAATAGSVVTIPGSVLRRVTRSSAKHVRANARLSARTLVKEVDRPLFLLADTLVVSPVTLSLTAAAGVAITSSLTLSANCIVNSTGSAAAVKKLGASVVVKSFDRTQSLTAESGVADTFSQVLTAQAAVSAVSFVSVSAAAGISVVGVTLPLTSESAVSAATTLSLTAQSAVQLFRINEISATGAVQHNNISTSLSALAGVTFTRSTLLSADASIAALGAGLSALSVDAAVAATLSLTLDADCSVEEPEPPLPLTLPLVAGVYVTVPGQLDATVYVVPIPRASWIDAKTAVRAAKSLVLGADTFVN